jgi:hypothetical protein
LDIIYGALITIYRNIDLIEIEIENTLLKKAQSLNIKVNKDYEIVHVVQKWNTKSFILKKPHNVIKINFSEIAEK